MKLSKHWKLLFSSKGPSSHFFGYYCHNPLSADGQKLLAHRVEFEGRELVAGDQSEIGYFSLPDGQWRTIGQTKAFNWQDGSMLQWVGESSTDIVYNIIGDNGQPASICVDLLNNNEIHLEKPVYTVHPSGQWALGVNVSRIAKCRPSYGYRDSSDQSKQWDGPLPEGDGLFKIDLKTGEAALLLKTRKLVDDSEYDFPESALHFIQNPIWNPSGTRLVALHRYTVGQSFRSRLFTVDSNGENLRFYPDAALYSHAKWRNDQEFVIWSNPGNSLSSRYLTRRGPKSAPFAILRRLLRPLAKQIKGNPRAKQRALGYGYFLFDDETGKRKPLAHGKIAIDGHPGFACDGQLMITDTYQDEQSYRHLVAFDLKTEEIEKIGQFYSPYNNCGYRCDLHPRSTSDGKLVCIDSAHSGQRQIYLFARD